MISTITQMNKHPSTYNTAIHSIKYPQTWIPHNDNENDDGFPQSVGTVDAAVDRVETMVIVSDGDLSPMTPPVTHIKAKSEENADTKLRWMESAVICPLWLHLGVAMTVFCDLSYCLIFSVFPNESVFILRFGMKEKTMCCILNFKVFNIRNY